MGIFSKLLNRNSDGGQSRIPMIKFGRFAEIDETEETHALRDACDDLYKEGRFLEAYVTYFNYLQKLGGPAVKMVFYQDTQELEFEFIQGSKIVTGNISQTDVSVRSDIATFEKLNVAMMRFLLTKNSDFSYCKFAIEDNLITLIQRCPIRDMSPEAFNDMLSELARNADGIDDVLVDEFPMLKPINVDNIYQLPENEVNAKINYIRAWIEETENLLLSTENDGTRSYIIFRLIFKILYLVSPEGTLLNELRVAYCEYDNFNDNEDNATEVNFKMMEIIRGIYRKSDEEIAKSLYTVPAVFPELSYVPFSDTVRSGMKLMSLADSCIENRREDLLEVMCEYIVGVHLFHQGMSPIATDLLLIFWRTLNPGFFAELGFEDDFYELQTEKLKAVKISEEIDRVIRYYSKTYRRLSFNTSNLDFGSPADFAYTFLQEFFSLNLPD